MGSPVDKEVQDALDRLEEALAEHYRTGDYAALGMALQDHWPTVRQEVQRLREERDEQDWRTLEIITAQLKAAEAENRQLHADALAFDNVREAFDDTLEANTRLARESNERLLEISRLREGLREIAEWDGRSAEIHGNRGVREYARALLSASPDGGGAK